MLTSQLLVQTVRHFSRNSNGRLIVSQFRLFPVFPTSKTVEIDAWVDTRVHPGRYIRFCTEAYP